MKCFIIYVESCNHSKQTSNQLYNQLINYNHSVNLFSGVDQHEAKKLLFKENRKKHPASVYNPNSIESFYFNNLLSNPGVIGCFYSHYLLWKKCVEINEEIAIFEDDVLIYRDYIPVEYNDILYLSFSMNVRNISDPRYSEKMNEKEFILNNYLLNPTEKPESKDYFNDRYGKIGYASGYLIKPKAANKFLETFSNTYTAADHALFYPFVEPQIHNHLMGRVRNEQEGNHSLIT